MAERFSLERATQVTKEYMREHVPVAESGPLKNAMNHTLSLTASYSRPMCLFLMANAYEMDHRAFVPVAVAIERSHGGSLAVDDRHDQAETRRGQPCAYLKFPSDTIDSAAIKSTNLGYPLIASTEFSAEAKVEIMTLQDKPSRVCVMGKKWTITESSQALMR